MHISTKCSIALHCLIFIAEYEQTHKVTGELLSKSTGCNPVIIRNILSALQKAELVSITRGVGGTHLNRQATEITVWDVYTALEPASLNRLIGIHSNPSTLCPVGIQIEEVLYPQYEQIENAVKREMQKICLSQLLDSYHALETNRK